MRILVPCIYWPISLGWKIKCHQKKILFSYYVGILFRSSVLLHAKKMIGKQAVDSGAPKLALFAPEKQRDYFLRSEQGQPLSAYKNQRFPQCAFGPSWLWLGMSSCTKRCQHLKRKVVSYKLTISSLLIWNINTLIYMAGFLQKSKQNRCPKHQDPEMLCINASNPRVVGG